MKHYWKYIASLVLAGTAIVALAQVPASFIRSGMLLSGQAVTANGLVLLETQTASGSAELDFTASISSTYDEYVIEVVNLINGSAANIAFQMSSDGGATYDTANNYAIVQYAAFPTGSGNAGTNATSGIFWNNASVTLASGASWNGAWRLFNPGSTTLHRFMTGQMGWQDSGSIITAQYSGSWNNTSNAMNAFRVKPDAGTLTSGVVRVYGLTKP